jgi:hypothetical protein
VYDGLMKAKKTAKAEEVKEVKEVKQEEAPAKDMAKKIKEAMKSLGHDISLGHSYEVLAKISGYKSWNVASKANDFLPKVNEIKKASVVALQADEPGKEEKEGSKQTFKVFLNAEATVEKAYYIEAKDEKEVRKIMKQYIDCQSGELTESEGLYEVVKKLLEVERDNSFYYENWSIYDSYGINASVAEVYKA